MIPLKYNVRNLRTRWVTTLLTVLGTGLVVWSSCILFGMVDGLQYSLNVSGEPLDLIVLRKGSTTETSGGFDLAKAEQVLTLPGIARNANGQPLAACELLNIPIAERSDGSRANIIVRGVDPASPELRPDFKIIQGRYFHPGVDECVVSRNLSGRFKGAELNGILRVGAKEAYRVVGVFTAGGSSAESEIWVDRKVLDRNTSSEGAVSCVQLRAASAPEVDALIERLDNDPQFRLDARREKEYFANQSRSSMFLKVFGTLIAVLLTIGAMFGAANTMFAAVSSRTREIGTMRALGFSRRDVLFSFLFEALLLSALGGVIGLVATLPLSALTFGTMDSDTFSERTIHFRFGPLVATVALTMTAAMGLFGGLFPALRAVRLNVINALREL